MQALTLNIQTPFSLDQLNEVLSNYSAEPVIQNRDENGNDQPVQVLVGSLGDWTDDDIDHLIDRLKLRDMKVEIKK